MTKQTDGLATAGGFENVEMMLRERTYTQSDPDDTLPHDAICDRERDYRANGQRFYRSRLDIEAADAIHALGVALASQIEITNTERANAERCATQAVEVRQAWLDIESAPRDGTKVLAYLHVYSSSTGNYLDTDLHVIWCNDETGNIHADAYQGWDLDDYAGWMPAPNYPAPPPMKGKGE